MLEVTDLRAGYGAIEVLKGISLRVDEGEIVTLIGANGAGKTSTLMTICGLVLARGGDIVFEGKSLRGLPAHEIVQRGLVQSPEGRKIFPRLTVQENLEMGAFTRRDHAGVAQDRERMFALFPILAERRAQPGGTLSGGEQQMLALARAVATDPGLLLIDELSMGLAPFVVDMLYELVAQIAHTGVTVIAVEQFARTILGIASSAAVITTGRVVKAGRSEEIADELTGLYLGQTAA
jgi:branched-chain amino acid transport system ATP-binding protein